MTVDTLRPLGAYDAGGRVRAMATIVSAHAEAKTQGIDPAAIAGALRLVGWEDESR